IRTDFLRLIGLGVRQTQQRAERSCQNHGQPPSRPHQNSPLMPISMFTLLHRFLAKLVPVSSQAKSEKRRLVLSFDGDVFARADESAAVHFHVHPLMIVTMAQRKSPRECSRASD